MNNDLLSEYVRVIIETRASPKKPQISVAAIPDWDTFSELARKIVGNALTISSDINEIAAVAAVNKGSAINAVDVMSFAQGGSAKDVLADRFALVLSKAEKAYGLTHAATQASAYVAGELARGSAMGIAAIADCGGGDAYWTADRGAKLADFIEADTEVSADNPTDFLVVTTDGNFGYSAKATVGAAANFKNPGLQVLEDLAGLTGGTAGGARDPEITVIYAAANKKMEKKVPGYSTMSAEDKKEYRDVAKELDLYNAVQGGVRDVFLEKLAKKKSSRASVTKFLRSFVPELPNPTYKVVFAKGLNSAVIKPPSASGAIALHIASPAAKLSAVASGTNGITFVSTASGKLFTYRIKFVGGFGTSLKGSVTA